MLYTVVQLMLIQLGAFIYYCLCVAFTAQTRAVQFFLRLNQLRQVFPAPSHL